MEKKLVVNYELAKDSGIISYGQNPYLFEMGKLIPLKGVQGSYPTIDIKGNSSS